MENESLYLKKNVGPIDRVVRVIVGIALVSAPVYLRWSPGASAISAALGGVMAFEGLIGY